MRQSIASGTVHGDLGPVGLQSPYASKPVGVAVGAEFRRDSIALDSSDASINGDLAGLGARRPAPGSSTVKELFGELSVPLAEKLPWLRSLHLSTGFRWSDYDLSGTKRTDNLGLTYAPTDDVSLRGGYNRAVRAPNIVELFAPSLCSIISTWRSM